MKRYLALVSSALCACGDDAMTRDDAATSGSEVVTSGSGLSGVLVDPQGQPLPLTDVLGCMATTCLYGESGADGRFHFDIEPPAEVALKTHADLARTPRHAAALVPVRITSTSLVDVGTLFTPDLPAGAMLGPTSADPQTLDAGDGLELTLRRADLTPAIGDVLFDVAARKLPAERVPAYPELAEKTVVAVYALHPFAAKSSSPIGVRLPTTLGDGTAAEIRTVSELDGVMSEPIAVTVSGGFIATTGGQGIARLTYLVVAQ